MGIGNEERVCRRLEGFQDASGLGPQFGSGEMPRMACNVCCWSGDEGRDAANGAGEAEREDGMPSEAAAPVIFARRTSERKASSVGLLLDEVPLHVRMWRYKFEVRENRLSSHFGHLCAG